MRLPKRMMPEDTPLHGALMDIITAYGRELYATGIQLSLQNDFHALKETGKSLDKLPLTPNFDPNVNDIGPANGFWMKGAGARYGYRHMQPHGMIWDIPSTGTLDEWVIWNDLDDIKWALMQPSGE